LGTSANCIKIRQKIYNWDKYKICSSIKLCKKQLEKKNDSIKWSGALNEGSGSNNTDVILMQMTYSMTY